MRKIISYILAVSIAMLSWASLANEVGSKELATMAVQNRAYTMKHEFVGWVGVLPMDAFTKGLTFSGAYTLHFNDAVAWEIAQFTYSYPVDTQLKEDLKNLEQPASPTPFEVVKYYGTSSIVFKPVYLKMALLNSKVFFGELFLLAGGGYGKMTITKRPVVNYGAGGRVYFGKFFSLRLDVRNYMFLNKEDVKNELWIALGAALSFK